MNTSFILLLSLGFFKASAYQPEVHYIVPTTQRVMWLQQLGYIVGSGYINVPISVDNQQLPGPPAAMPTTLAPLGRFTIIGEHLTDNCTNKLNDNNVYLKQPWPTTFGGVRVMVDQMPVPLTFICDRRIDGQLPETLRPGKKYSLVVEQVKMVNGVFEPVARSEEYSFFVQSASPAALAVAHSDGLGYPVTAEEPLAMGEFGFVLVSNAGLLVDRNIQPGTVGFDFWVENSPATRPFVLSVEYTIMGKSVIRGISSQTPAALHGFDPGIYYLYFRVNGDNPLPDPAIGGQPNATLILCFRGQVVSRIPFFLR